jgi:xylulose-5-phosphate/fructose-6-phosphate phosphoketolase
MSTTELPFGVERDDTPQPFSKNFNQESQRHHDYIREHLEYMPEVRNWQWTKDFSNAAAPGPLAKRYPQKAMFTDS